MSKKPRKSLRYGSTKKSNCQSCALNSMIQSGLQSSSKVLQKASRLSTMPFKYQKKKDYKNMYTTITLVLILAAFAIILYFMTTPK